MLISALLICKSVKSYNVVYNIYFKDLKKESAHAPQWKLKLFCFFLIYVSLTFDLWPMTLKLYILQWCYLLSLSIWSEQNWRKPLAWDLKIYSWTVWLCKLHGVIVTLWVLYWKSMLYSSLCALSYNILHLKKVVFKVKYLANSGAHVSWGLVYYCKVWRQSRKNCG